MLPILLWMPLTMPLTIFAPMLSMRPGSDDRVLTMFCTNWLPACNALDPIWTPSWQRWK